MKDVRFVKTITILTMMNIVKIAGEMKFKIICFLGRYSKRVRKWYWLKNKHAYPWGLYIFVDDDFEGLQSPPYQTGSFSMADFDKMFKINNNK